MIAMNNSSVVLKKKFRLSKQQLFEAWSNPQVMRRWLFAAQLRDNCCSVNNNFVTNGEYKIVMHFDESGDVELFGKYVEIDRYSKIVFTWSNNILSNSLVTLSFKKLSENSSELTLEHSLFPDKTTRDEHVKGWQQCLLNLASVLEEVSESG